MIGSMAMPDDFPYREIFLKGQPVHSSFDAFRIRHPSMNIGRRAKIFSPFDALRGFDEAVSSKNIPYELRREIIGADETELNRRINILYSLTCDRKSARQNKVTVQVVYYVPCTDQNNFSYGVRGRYVTLSGTISKTDCNFIWIDQIPVVLTDIIRVESSCTIDGKNIFDDLPESLP